MKGLRWDEAYYKEGEDPDHPNRYVDLTLRDYDDDDGSEPIACVCYDEDDDGCVADKPWGVFFDTDVVARTFKGAVREHPFPQEFFVALYKACQSLPDNATDEEILSMANTIFALEN